MTIIPKLNIHLYSKCPHCNIPIDLFRYPYYNITIWEVLKAKVNRKDFGAIEFKCFTCGKLFYMDDMEVDFG